MIEAPKFIERSDPRSFCNAVLAKMSKRNKDDMTRVQALVGEIVLLRMTAARYMDPYFVNGEVERIYKRFGSAIEAAYQTMIAEIGALDERKREEQARANSSALASFTPHGIGRR